MLISLCPARVLLPIRFLEQHLAEPDCPLTDRELRDRANHAKKFAKDHGKNRIATYEGPRLVPEDLRVVRPEGPAA